MIKVTNAGVETEITIKMDIAPVLFAKTVLKARASNLSIP
jgi:hypothetical protein